MKARPSRKPLLTMLLCLLLLGGMPCMLPHVQAQHYPVLRWQKFYGRQGDDIPTVIRKSLDGHLILGGSVGLSSAGCSDGWVVKVDTLGNVLWERQLGGSGCEEIRDIIITPDSGLIFTGISSSFIEHPEKGQEGYQGDYFIGKLDKRGDIEWLKSYGGLDLDQGFGIAKVRGANEYIIAGVSHSQNFDVETELQMANAWLVRINGRGEKVGAFALGGSKHDWAYSICNSRDGDFIVAGYTNSEDIDGTERRTNGDGWVVRVDRYGSVRWQRIYSGKYEDYFSKVLEDRDGRLVVVGNFESEDRAKQFWFLKLTADGKKLYETILGDGMDECLVSAAECSSGGYILTGYSKYNNLANKYIKGGEDFWIIRVNGRGETLWMNTYGGRDGERGADILEYRPGVYYAIGEKLNNFEASPRGKDFWLLRLDEEACDQMKISVTNTLKENTAYVGKPFTFKINAPDFTRIVWDFGDGSTSEEVSPSKTYSLAGVYEIKVTVFFSETCYKVYTVPKYLMVW